MLGVFEYKGQRFNTTAHEMKELEKVEDISGFDDTDIIVSTYPKTGYKLSLSHIEFCDI